MHEEQLQLLKEIMAMDFSVIEFNLFLDTHPNDQRALAELNSLCCQSKALRRRYEQCYGPLMPCGDSPPRLPWAWVEEPWPWQIDYGRS